MPGSRGRADPPGGSPLHRVLSALRRVWGMPDYPAFVAHVRSCHPERTVPSEREFYDEYVRTRYGDGPTRCC